MGSGVKDMNIFEGSLIFPLSFSTFFSSLDTPQLIYLQGTNHPPKQVCPILETQPATDSKKQGPHPGLSTWQAVGTLKPLSQPPQELGPT